MEAKLQSKIITWLKAKGCVVIKLSAVPGVPNGIPDILFLLDGGGWGCLEVKASKTARFQPLQKYWIEELNRMYFARAVYPENWSQVQKEIEKII